MRASISGICSWSGLDLLIDQAAIAQRTCANQANPAVSEVQHLEGAGIADQLFNMRGDQLFGTDEQIDWHRVLRKQLLWVLFMYMRADVLALRSSVGGRLKTGIGHLAGDHIDFVTTGQRDHHVGVFGAGALSVPG